MMKFHPYSENKACHVKVTWECHSFISGQAQAKDLMFVNFIDDTLLGHFKQRSNLLVADVYNVKSILHVNVGDLPWVSMKGI